MSTDGTRVLRSLRSAWVWSVLLAVGMPIMADEQPDEESTTLPPDLVVAARAATALSPAGPPVPGLAEIVLPPTTLAALPRPQEELSLKEVSGPSDEERARPVPAADAAAAAQEESEAEQDPETEPAQQADRDPVLDQREAIASDELEPIVIRLGTRERAGPVPPTEDPDAGADDDPLAWGPPSPASVANEFGAVPLRLLGREVAPGTRERLYWTTGQSFSGSAMDTPVMVLHGMKPGPRLCLTAGVHGDELNGIEVVRRLAYKFEPEQLSGTVVAVPIVNLLGFSRGSRYLPDRRDLNRFFPGNPRGSSASRIADSFFTSVVRGCDALIDVHTGSLNRANLPQVRGDLTDPLVLEFTRGFGATAVLHSAGESGMLRYAASRRSIPAVTLEIGGPQRLQPEEIEHGVQAIETLLSKMGMIEQRRRWREPQAVYYESRWVRVDDGGMLFTEVGLGDRVRAGQLLGRVIDPVSNRSTDVLAPEDARVLGMALNQLVLPGFAAFNLGIAASEELVVEAILDADRDDDRYLENDGLDQEPRERTEAPDRTAVDEHDLHPEEPPQGDYSRAPEIPAPGGEVGGDPSHRQTESLEDEVSPSSDTDGAPAVDPIL